MTHASKMIHLIPQTVIKQISRPTHNTGNKLNKINSKFNVLLFNLIINNNFSEMCHFKLQC